MSIAFMLDRVTFSARRRRAQADMIAALEPVVGDALDAKQAGRQGWFRQVVDAARPLWEKIVKDDGGDPAKAKADWARTALHMATVLTKTKHIDEYSHTVIATFVAGMVLDSATISAAEQAGEPYEIEWVSMHDSKVRHTHKVADGQRIKRGEKFLVGQAEMDYPHDVTAPIKEWINCRCTVAPVPVHDNEAAAVDTDGAPRGETMTIQTGLADQVTGGTLLAAVDSVGLIPWHGMMAPEGKWSGDGRRFADGSLSTRDLALHPLPLTFQEKTAPAHDNADLIGMMEWADMRDGQMWAGGHLLQNEAADKAVGVLAHFGKFGVSVDADDAEMELEYDVADSEMPTGRVTFTKARVCGACAVPIPAFEGAFVTLGMDPNHDYGDQMDPDMMDEPTEPDDSPDEDKKEQVASNLTAVKTFISEKPWDGSASRFTPQQWKTSCILHKCSGMEKSCHSLPIKEPGGQLSRAGVHAAAGRLNQVDAPASAKAAAKRALRSAYAALGEDPPDSLKAALEETEEEKAEAMRLIALLADGTLDEFDLSLAEQLVDYALLQFRRGPGWITNPVPTKRIHDYWTVPGQPGYEKIGWGTDGDFNRCRVEIGQEIAEHDPATVARYMNQICAQWHHDATGFWPGHAPGETALASPEGDPAPALTLVASVARTAAPPHEWFTDPEFDGPTPFTIEEDEETGLLHIYGHVCDWSVCHMSFATPGECINPGPSTSGYSWFLVGETMTDAGGVPTGVITVDTGHARKGPARPAIAHYDNTGAAVADVAAGDDEHGLWVNGWVRPWATEAQVHELRANPPSGDWRLNPNTGEMDMIAVLCVNAPGLPVRRIGFENGHQVSLVASFNPPHPADEDPVVALASAVADEIEGRQRRRQTVAALAADFEEDD